MAARPSGGGPAASLLAAPVLLLRVMVRFAGGALRVVGPGHAGPRGTVVPGEKNVRGQRHVPRIRNVSGVCGQRWQPAGPSDAAPGCPDRMIHNAPSAEPCPGA